MHWTKKETQEYVIGYLLTLAVSWIVWCLVDITDYLSLSGSELWKHLSLDFIDNTIEAFVLYAFSIFSCRMQIRYLWNRRNNRRMLMFGISLHVLANACFTLMVACVYYLTCPSEENIFYHILLSDYFVIGLLSSIYLSLSLIKKGRDEETLALQTKLDMLALQMNNHFIFNSFATAAGLIRHAPEAAEMFLKRLAAMYRYLTQNSGTHLVLLEEEIEFVDNYIQLLKERYSGVSVSLSHDLRARRAYLPPASIQILIENAVKHNSHGPKQNLSVEVALEGDSVVVTNNLLKRCDEVVSSGTGLANLRKRYKLLTEQNVLVENDGRTFRVTLPLVFKKDLYYESSDN